TEACGVVRGAGTPAPHQPLGSVDEIPLDRPPDRGTSRRGTCRRRHPRRRLGDRGHVHPPRDRRTADRGYRRQQQRRMGRAMTAPAALPAVETTPGLRPPSRPVRAWLLTQAGIYALAASAAVERAITTTTPIARADVDPLTSVPGIRELLLVIGLVFAGAGTILAWRGVGFPRRRDLMAAPARLRPAVHRLGQVGAVTRGVMFLLPGLLLVIEAWTYHRGSFGRVSQDVRITLQQPWGRLLLAAAALGLAAFAAYELAAAAYRREPPDDDAVGLAPSKPSVLPLWTVALILLVGAAGLWGGLVVLGHAVEAASPTSGRGPDQAVVAWLAGHRTSTLNQLSAVGSALADTMTCITVTAVAAVVFAIWLGRWRESAVLVLTVTGQLFIFLLV